MATITLPALRQNTVNLLSYAVAGRVTSSSGSGTVFGGTPARVYLNEVGLRVGDVVSGSAEILYANGGSRVEIQARDAEGTNIGEKVSAYTNNTSFTRREVHAFTIPAGTAFLTVGVARQSGSGTVFIRNAMINRGGLAMPYEHPKRGAWAPIVHGGVFRDDNQVPLDFFSGASQLTSYPGRRWLLQFSTPLLRGDELREWSLALDLLADRSNVFRFVPPEYTGPSTGYAGPNPVVNGAGQTGDALICDGVDAEADIVGPGDFLSFEVTTPKGNTNVELHRVKSLAASDSGGNVTIQLTRPMRLSPADNAVVQIYSPIGQFRLAEPRAGQDIQLLRRASVSVEAEEAIYP